MCDSSTTTIIDEVGNCTIQSIIKALHNGWRVKEIRYKGFNFAGGYGNPMWIPHFYYPEGTVYSDWYRWTPDMKNEFERCPPESGYNTVIFEKDNCSQPIKNEEDK